MEIVSIKDQNLISKTLEVLNKGGIVIFPTETCYGVGVDATNTDAVTKVLKYKKRPPGKAISVACFDLAMANNYLSLNQMQIE